MQPFWNVLSALILFMLLCVTAKICCMHLTTYDLPYISYMRVYSVVLEKVFYNWHLSDFHAYKPLNCGCLVGQALYTTGKILNENFFNENF